MIGITYYAVSSGHDKIYLGSTRENQRAHTVDRLLAVRKRKHECAYRLWKQNGTGGCAIFALLDHGPITLFVIEVHDDLPENAAEASRVLKEHEQQCFDAFGDLSVNQNNASGHDEKKDSTPARKAAAITRFRKWAEERKTCEYCNVEMKNKSRECHMRRFHQDKKQAVTQY